MFNNAKSIYFKGNEVKLIERTRDGAILYEKAPTSIELFSEIKIKIYSSSFSFTPQLSQGEVPFENNVSKPIYLDRGDGELIDITNQRQYTTSVVDDTVKIYNATRIQNAFMGQTNITEVYFKNGIEEIGNGIFSGCDNLTFVNISKTVTSLPDITFFINCNILSQVRFNWTTSNDIIQYKDLWFKKQASRTSAEFVNADPPELIIPKNTTDLYIAKGYPSNKLIEAPCYEIIGEYDQINEKVIFKALDDEGNLLNTTFRISIQIRSYGLPSIGSTEIQNGIYEIDISNRNKNTMWIYKCVEENTGMFAEVTVPEENSL